MHKQIELDKQDNYLKAWVHHMFHADNTPNVSS